MSAYQSCLIMISPLFPAPSYLSSLEKAPGSWTHFLMISPTLPFILHVTIGNSLHVSSKGSVEASSKRLSFHPSLVEKGPPAALGGSLVT